MNKSIKIGPTPQIIHAILATSCSLQLLESCMVPQIARVELKLNEQQEAKVISGPHFVRGVNSCFYLIETANKMRVYVHEQYVRFSNN